MFLDFITYLPNSKYFSTCGPPHKDDPFHFLHWIPHNLCDGSGVPAEYFPTSWITSVRLWSEVHISFLVSAAPLVGYPLLVGYPAHHTQLDRQMTCNNAILEQYLRCCVNHQQDNSLYCPWLNLLIKMLHSSDIIYG